MKTISAAALVFVLAFLVGCVDEPRDTDSDVEGLQDEIEATNARFESHVAAQQWDSVAALYTSDAIMMPQGAPMQRGANAIRDGFVQMGEQGGVSNIRIETSEVEASGDLAYEIGQYTLEGRGGEQVDRGKYLIVWKREGDNWKIYRDIFNSDSMLLGSGLPADTTEMAPGDEPGTMQDDTTALMPDDTAIAP